MGKTPYFRRKTPNLGNVNKFNQLCIAKALLQGIGPEWHFPVVWFMISVMNLKPEIYGIPFTV
jgi:hypothetical protein